MTAVALRVLDKTAESGQTPKGQSMDELSVTSADIRYCQEETCAYQQRERR